MANTDAPPASPTQNPFPAWYLRRGVINATDNALENASSSCESWEIGCAAVVVLSVAAEFVLAMIHPSYDSLWNRVGSAVFDAAIALGIVGEVIFGRLDARFQTELRRRSTDKLSEAIDRLAQVEFDNGFLQESAAMANARASEAQLELARLMSPRSLSKVQSAAIVSKLANFSGRSAMVIPSPYTYEGAVFADQIHRILQSGSIRSQRLARWLVTGPNIVAEDVHVSFIEGDDASRAFAEAIVGALITEGVKAESSSVGGEFWSAMSNNVLVVIGTKT